jgi:mRNA-degrading endonuclease RelE of RelBE toxin-antitoxin system
MTESPIQVAASPTFNRNLRTLAKKYCNIQRDIQPVIEQLEQGESLGDRIPGVAYKVFKLRVRNSDVQKGKSGGYRLIYYVKLETSIILLTIYTKSEQANLAADEIRSIITEYDQLNINQEEL